MAPPDNLIPRERNVLTWLFIHIRAGVVAEEFYPRPMTTGQFGVLQKDLISGQERPGPIPQCGSLETLERLYGRGWLGKVEDPQKDGYALTRKAEELGEAALQEPLRLIVQTIREHEISNSFRAMYGTNGRGKISVDISSIDKEDWWELPEFIPEETFAALAGSGYLQELSPGAFGLMSWKYELTDKALHSMFKFLDLDFCNPLKIKDLQE